MKFIGIALLLVSMTAPGQDAKVIALSPKDAAEAKALYAQKAEIEKKISDLQELVAQKYTRTDGRGSRGWLMDVSGRYYLHGFEDGFTFSEDFKYIVPKPSLPPTQSYCGGLLGGACFTTNVVNPVSVLQ